MSIIKNPLDTTARVLVGKEVISVSADGTATLEINHGFDYMPAALCFFKIGNYRHAHFVLGGFVNDPIYRDRIKDAIIYSYVENNILVIQVLNPNVAIDVEVTYLLYGDRASAL